MKVSEDWLRTWIDPDISTEALCDQLTNLGLEVDDVGSTYGHISDVVVAQIVELKAVPNSDGKTINLCQVDDGSERYSVICGAPNAREGLKTAFARVGATIAERISVQQTRLYGKESIGMLCSEAELGISSLHSGIIEFDADTTLGQDVKPLLDMNDVTIDIDLTPNRGDCLSIRGIAREVGVINRMPINQPVIEKVVARSDEEIPITLQNSHACPRYLGRVLTNIHNDVETPSWMVRRLVGCGLRPIDPVVDVTNYVMLELGQPLHAFDLSNVQRGIVVRDSTSGEKLKLLDGTELTFDDQTLLITDGETPLAVAGVMGGERSGIQPTTTDVFLECAFFTPDAIIGTPRKYSLQTDASARYERGVDPNLQYDALERVTQLLLDIVGGEPGPITVAEDPLYLPHARSITLRKNQLERLIGEEIPNDEVEEVLTRLGLEQRTNEESWDVTVPSYRFDVSIEQDLIEEVCRVHGYNAISASYPEAQLRFDDSLLRESESQRQRTRMAELGYFEVVTYSFIDPSANDRFSPSVEAPVLENPLATQYAVMRKSLLPGLVGATRYNLSRQQDTVRLFEYGKCFYIEDGETVQVDKLGGIAIGKRSPEVWAEPKAAFDFFDLKGDMERLLDLLPSSVSFERSNKPYLHPGRGASIIAEGSAIGDFGKLHPEISMEMELPEDTYVFELNADLLHIGSVQMAHHIPPFPYVRRDLALLVDESLAVQSLTDAIRENLGEVLVDLHVFDHYIGDNIEQGKKSVALGLMLQNPKQTLTDEVVNQHINDLLTYVGSAFGAQQR